MRSCSFADTLKFVDLYTRWASSLREARGARGARGLFFFSSTNRCEPYNIVAQSTRLGRAGIALSRC